MARVEVHIRRPPCRYCTNGLMHSAVARDQRVLCGHCRGRAGIVEYSMFVSTDHGTVGWWLNWPTEEQQAMVTRHDDLLFT